MITFKKAKVFGIDKMWCVQKIETFKSQFNFISSGQGMVTRTSLSIDDIIVINQIGALDNTPDNENVFQFIVCEECGFTQCKSGDWVAIRKSGDNVLFIPAFAWIFEKEWGENEYLPPYYLLKKGAILFTSERFEKLKNLVPFFAEFNQFRHLTNTEALNLLKFEAPRNMFGALPKFTDLSSEKLITASEGELDYMINLLHIEIKKLEIEESEICIEPVSKNDLLISFYLDDTSATEWKALYRNETGYGLLIGETFKLRNIEKRKCKDEL